VAGSTADRGPETWCAAHIWLGSAAANLSDFTGALSHFTAVRDAAAGQPQPLADALAGRAIALVNLGRIPEGISDARQAVTVARDAGYPAGEALSLANLALAMFYARIWTAPLAGHGKPARSTRRPSLAGSPAGAERS
jgi:hypothetical protein